MSQKIILLALVYFLFLNKNCGKVNAQVLNNRAIAIEKAFLIPSYEDVDSIVIDYLIPSNSDAYSFIIKRSLIKIRKRGSSMDVLFENLDYIFRFNGLINSLFISGKEKTEIGRTYRTRLVFGEEPEITITIFLKDKTEISHNIKLAMETCDIEFSETFKKFYKLLDELCEKAN